MVIGFDHIGIVVKDLDAIVSFYRDKLGLKAIREVNSVASPEGNHTGIPGASRKIVFMGMPGSDHFLELVHFINPPSPEGHLTNHQLGASHVCLAVDDIEGVYKRLSAAGVQFVTPPRYSPTPEGARIGICYALDPEGNYVELIDSEL